MWALVNLIAAILTVLIAVGMVITFFRKRKDEDEEDETYRAAHVEEEQDGRRKRRASKFFGLIPAVAAVIAFILTEDMRLKMVLVDRWTPLMVVILAVGAVLAVLTRNKKPKDDEEISDEAENG